MELASPIDRCWASPPGGRSRLRVLRVQLAIPRGESTGRRKRVDQPPLRREGRGRTMLTVSLCTCEKIDAAHSQYESAVLYPPRIKWLSFPQVGSSSKVMVRVELGAGSRGAASLLSIPPVLRSLEPEAAARRIEVGGRARRASPGHDLATSPSSRGQNQLSFSLVRWC